MPVFLIKPLVSPQFLSEIGRTDLYLKFLTEALIFGFAFGGLAAVSFEVLFHQKLKTVPHPHRVHLNWLVFGPLAFLFLKIIVGLSFAISLASGFIIQVLTLIYLRKDLLWDAITSGIFLGVVYLIFYSLFLTIIPGNNSGLWFAEPSGIMIWRLPVEEAAMIFAFGMLWGPLYEGIKGYQLKLKIKN